MEYEILLSVYFLVIWLNHVEKLDFFFFFLTLLPGMQLRGSLGV